MLDASPRVTIAYGDIPNVPTSSVEGHAGKLVAGTVHGTPTMLLSGRAHPYEGYSQRESTLLLRAVLALGADTRRAHECRRRPEPGLRSRRRHAHHRSPQPVGRQPAARAEPRPLRHALPGDDRCLRPGAPGRGEGVVGATGVALREGIYIMLTGPAFETRAEMRMLRGLGGDAVGMSTAHETIVARHAGARVLAFSLITNKATEDVAERRDAPGGPRDGPRRCRAARDPAG